MLTLLTTCTTATCKMHYPSTCGPIVTMHKPSQTFAEAHLYMNGHDVLYGYLLRTDLFLTHAQGNLDLPGALLH